MEFRILGPLELRVNGTIVTLSSAKQRALLGVLLLHANEVVSSDRLVGELWGARPPPTSGKLVQVYVSQLRRALAAVGGQEVVRTRAPGYVAVLEPDQLDAARFTAKLARARATAEAGSLDEAVALYEDALALWRGPVLADVAFESYARTDTELLAELRLAALSERVDCEFARGHHAQLIGELESLTAEHPLHERFSAQLMLALYRSGRQSEALGAYRQARRVLRDQVGLDPGPELRRLEKAILAHDPSLELGRSAAPLRAHMPPAPEGRPPRSRRYRFPVVAAATTLLLVTGGAALLLARDHGAPPPLAAIAPDSVVIVDPSRNEAVDEIPLHTRPSAVEYGDGYVWVGAADEGTLLRIDPDTHAIRPVGLGAAPTEITTADGFVWVLTKEQTVFQIRSDSMRLVRRIVLPKVARVGRFAGRPFSGPFPGCRGLTAGAGAAWISCYLPLLLRIDERTGDIEQHALGCGFGVSFDGRALWCAAGLISPDPRPRPLWQLSRIDPATRRVTQTIPPPRVGAEIGAGRVTAGPHRILLTDRENSALVQIDPGLGRAREIVPLQHPPIDSSLLDDDVWTANADGTLSRVDSTAGRVVRTVPLGKYPRAAYPVQIAGGGDRVWVAVH